MNNEQAATSTPEYPTINAVVEEGVKFIKSFGKAISASVQDLPDYMVVNVNQDIREKLDALVEAGIVKNRRGAAQFLIKEGLKNHTKIFDKIDETKTKIADLRQQLQEIAQEQT